MEDIIYFLLMAAVMIGGAVSSANKKKKQREAAQRKTQRQTPDEIEVTEKPSRKSLAEILEELARDKSPEEYGYESTEAPEDVDDGYYDRETSYFDYVKEGGRVTESQIEDTAYMVSSTPKETSVPVMQTHLVEEPQEVQPTLESILGGEFDLRRAVIESEILNPKYKQY